MNGTTQSPGDDATPQTRPGLAMLAWRFLKIGAIGFGGGMAVIALMERECVHRHRCIEAEEFIHGVGLGQILGPFAVNTALFIGYRKRGIIGGLVAATSFLLPSVVLVIALAWLYFSYHTIPSLQRALLGVAPVVIALIVSAALTMGRKSVRSWPTLTLATLACAGSLLHVNAVWILAGAGAVGLLLRHSRSSRSSVLSVGAMAAPLPAAVGAAPVATASVLPSAGLAGLTGTFFKVGLIFFGGGFVLVPILHQRLVSDLGWLTQGEFLDGVAISQLTPGPIAVLATFAGYHVGGPVGAILATAALFLPAIILMLLISHFYQRLRHVSAVKDFLAGVVPAVVGLVLAAAVSLVPGTLAWQHPAGLIIAVVALGLLAWRQWHPALVLLLGAGIGTLIPSLLR